MLTPMSLGERLAIQEQWERRLRACSMTKGLRCSAATMILAQALRRTGNICRLFHNTSIQLQGCVCLHTFTFQTSAIGSLMRSQNTTFSVTDLMRQLTSQ